MSGRTRDPWSGNIEPTDPGPVGAGGAGGAASVVACIGPDVVDGSDGVTADHLKRGIG